MAPRINYIYLIVLSFLYNGCNQHGGLNSRTLEISPVDQWKNLIVGTWRYELNTDMVYEKVAIDGEVEYRQDGTFVRTMTIKGYASPSKIGEVDIHKGSELLVSGGIIKGTWYIDEKEQILVEAESECNLHTSKSMLDLENFDSCEWLNDTMFIGNHFNDYHKNSLVLFNENNIEYIANYFASDLNLEYKATKNSDK